MTDVSQNGVACILHHAEAAGRKAEILEEPDHAARHEDDGAGLDDERLAALPHVDQHALWRREVVLRKLHDEGGGVAREHPRLLEDDAREDDHEDAEEVGRRGHPGNLREVF